MKYWPLILTGTCALSIACSSSDTSSKKEGVHCPDFLLKGQGLPLESILIGVLPGSKIKLRSGALITKTGSSLQEHVWDEEALYFENSPDSTSCLWTMQFRTKWTGGVGGMRIQPLEFQPLQFIGNGDPNFGYVQRSKSKVCARFQFSS